MSEERQLQRENATFGKQRTNPESMVLVACRHPSVAESTRDAGTFVAEGGCVRSQMNIEFEPNAARLGCISAPCESETSLHVVSPKNNKTTKQLWPLSLIHI